MVVVDDHTLMRQGLVGLLNDEPDITVEAEAGTAVDGINMVNVHEPDVVLMDVGLPDMSGIKATSKIKKAHPLVGVLILTMHDR